ncbi:hypothetical protein ACKKBG_A07365 [Auxenochlorella protothecoides x Auxenochlorella symbiontica]
MACVTSGFCCCMQGTHRSSKACMGDSPSPLQLLQWSKLVCRPCICRAPTKTPFNQQSYHGRDELFPSDHYDDINVQSVEGPCRVLTRGEYTVRRGPWDLRKTCFCMFHTHSPQIGACRGLMYHRQLSHQEATEQVANGLKEDDGIPCFYTCVEYKAAKRAFHPDRIDVYCCCNMPYNPDLDMIQCTCCEDFFHAACIGATNEELPYLSNLGFVCMECAMAKEAAGALPGTYRK